MTPTRWLALGGLVAVILVVVLAQFTEWRETEQRLPPQGEARRNPFYAMQRVADALGARTSWEHALGTPSPEGVVVLSAFHWNLLPARQAAVERWVEAGGRLVVDDRLLSVRAFELWSGISWDSPADENDDENDDKFIGPVDGRAPKLCRDLRTAVDGGGLRRRRYRLCEYSDGTWLVTPKQAEWRLLDDDGPQALRVRVGRGTVTVINASPFTGVEPLAGEHARLFVDATQLRSGDEVHFITENERPSLLALIWRYGAPVVMLAAVWIALALWRGGQRFGPLVPPTEPVRRSLAEQIRGAGHFALRSGASESLHRAAARALDEAAQRRVSGFQALDVDGRAAALARLTTFDVPTLAAAMTLVDFRNTNAIRSSVSVLERARRQLLTKQTGREHGTE